MKMSVKDMKKAVVLCSSPGRPDCNDCPYKDCESYLREVECKNTSCSEALAADVLLYIARKEAQINVYKLMVAQLKEILDDPIYEED